MKKILIFLVVIIFSTNGFARTNTSGNDPVNTPTVNGDTNGKNIQSQSIQPQHDKTVEKDSKQDTAKTSNSCCSGKSQCIGKVISVLPVLLYLFMMLLIFNRLKKDNYKISDALKENEPVAMTNSNSTQAPGAAPAITASTTSVQPNSSSRLIAFLTGMTTLTLIACLTTYWMYENVCCCKEVDFSKITSLFITLGLGVVPYGANKIASAFK